MPNKLIARKIRLVLALVAGALAVRLALSTGRLPEAAGELAAIEWLLYLLAGLTALVTFALNPLREDRVPDRFPAIVQDAIVVGIFLVIATLIYPERLLTASAVGAVVIGFALQDTLGNAFSGLAIQIEKPFRVGHWISVGAFEGRVTEITWRATRLRTKTGNFVVVPNSVISKEAITNFSEPASPTQLWVDVGITYDAAPTKVKSVMLDALRQAPLVLASPPPDVLLIDFAASSVNYRARYWVNDFRMDQEAADQVRTALFYALRRNGIEIPYPIQVEYSRQEAAIDPAAQHARRTSALAGIEMFSALTDAERSLLAAAAAERPFGSGERIVRQGEPGESMFVLIEGSARVFIEPDTEVATIEAGGCFGEMSLLTGDPRTASVAARGDCVVLEIAPDAFNEIARLNPSALERVTSLASARRGPLDQARLAALASAQSVVETGLLARMKRWIRS